MAGPRLQRVFGRRPSRMLEGVKDEEDDRDTDAGIGDVEGGPGVGQRNVQIDEQKVDDVTVEETVGEISHYAGQEQRQ